jgi:predicted outer membrane repeat protein
MAEPLINIREAMLMQSGRRTSSLRTGAGRIAILCVSLASGLALVAGFTLTSAVLSSPAGAATTFTVTDAGDDNGIATNCTTPVADACTLRGAVAAANADTGNVDTIDFAAGITTVSLNIGSGVINMTNSMVINGTGVTVNATGNGTDGVFEDDTAATSVQITGLTIENGTHTTGDGVGGGFELQAGAALTLDSVTFSSNTASAGGGAIFDNGTLTVDDSTFNSNTSTGTTNVTGGGAINMPNPDGSASISGSTFTGNAAEFGGGIDSPSTATLTLTNSQINNSTCTGTLGTEGCGIYDFGTVGTYDNVSLSGTSATDTGPVGVEGGAVYLKANANQVSGLTISGTTVSASSVEGGALYNDAGGTTTVTNASITNTTVNGTGATGVIDGGVIYNVAGLSLTTVNATGATLTADEEVQGGFFDNDGAATATDVTFGSGTVSVTGGATPEADGSALFNDGTLAATNMTVDDVTATVAAGGTFNYGVDIASATGNTFTNATIANNTMSGPAANTFGLFVVGGDSLSLLNTIVAASPAATNCGFGTAGAIASQGHNLDNGASCDMNAAGDLKNANPEVQPLANNGGSVLTGALASTSPAIDAGTNTGCPTTDARGVSRPQGTSCDIGAYEYVTPAPPPPPPPTPAPTEGYWMVGNDGGIFNYGNAGFHGSMGGQHLNAPIVAMASTADGGGYWEVASDGGIFNFGDAGYHGSMGGQHLNEPIVGIASTPDGGGYWEVASDGGIFNFGDAHFYGSMGGQHLNKPIVGIASTHDGNGYWEVASDGGIFAFGDAHFYGSTGAISLNKPVVGMIATADGNGYWFVASDGGIFNYGDAAFFGSAGSLILNQPVVGMGVAPQGGGYWLFAADGGLFNYGSATYQGSVPGSGVHVTNIVGGATT